VGYHQLPAVGYHQLSRGSSTYTPRPAGYPSGGVPPAVERQLHFLTYSHGPPHTDAELLALAAAVERLSTHPLAHAVVTAASEGGAPTLQVR
jgi:hypothetical protein